MDAIEPGLDFVEAIDRALSETEVMLVVIGPKWLSGATSGRLHEPGDYVRLEIEAGLRRPEMRVGALTMRKSGERRRRKGIALIVAGLVAGVLSVTFYVIAVSQGWL